MKGFELNHASIAEIVRQRDRRFEEQYGKSPKDYDASLPVGERHDSRSILEPIFRLVEDDYWDDGSFMEQKYHASANDIVELIASYLVLWPNVTDVLVLDPQSYEIPYRSMGLSDLDNLVALLDPLTAPVRPHSDVCGSYLRR